MKINGYSVFDHKPIEITITNKQIDSIRELKTADTKNLLCHPFVDIQVNGFHGYDLNIESVTPDDISKMVHKLWDVGTGFLCPTIVTASFDNISKSLSAVVKACENDPLIAHSILGIHLEGPYISPEDGPRGAHPLAHVRNPNWDEFNRLQDIAEGMIRIVTLAPEKEGAIQFIEKVVATGVIVSIGHTNASTKVIQKAIRAGAKLSTHLGNGAHAMIQRHPNYIWDQLAADELYASLIVDGHHLPPSVVKSMIRAKTLEKCILISDATALAGMPTGNYEFAGQPVELKDDSSIRLSGTEYLAGSAIVLAAGVENTAKYSDISIKNAISLATIHPLQLLGIEKEMDFLKQPTTQDLIVFEWDSDKCKMDLIMTILDGQVVFSL